MDRTDFWDSLADEASSSITQRVAYAQTEALTGVESGVMTFLRQAKNEEDLKHRLAIAKNTIDHITEVAARKYEVDKAVVSSYIYEKVAAGVAVTEPKTVSPDSPIGGSDESSKYSDTDEKPSADGTTTVDDEGAVVEKAVRHKEETVDLNKDKQKDASVKESASSLDLRDLMEICKEYNQMGWAVIEQLETYLETGSLEGLNPNAVEYFQDFLRTVIRIAQGTLAGEEALTELNQLETMPVDENEIY